MLGKFVVLCSSMKSGADCICRMFLLLQWENTVLYKAEVDFPCTIGGGGVCFYNSIAMVDPGDPHANVYRSSQTFTELTQQSIQKLLTLH